LTLRVAEWLKSKENRVRVRQEFPTHFVLVDEVQDLSTLELRIIRKLVPNLEGQNRFFFVGDLNQKVYAKQHKSTQAGFDFKGRAAILRQNFRNTRQILQAAYCLPEMFPPQGDEPVEIANPEYSPYDGGAARGPTMHSSQPRQADSGDCETSTRKPSCGRQRERVVVGSCPS
jgi:ATP-dependent exoDNAse (exonuclease V) beta subunit